VRGDHTGDVLGRCGERGTILQQVSPHRKHPSLKFHPPTNGVNLTFRLSRSRAHARSPAGPHILSLTRPSRLRGDSAPRGLSLSSRLSSSHDQWGARCTVLHGTARRSHPDRPRRSRTPLHIATPSLSPALAGPERGKRATRAAPPGAFGRGRVLLALSWPRRPCPSLFVRRRRRRRRRRHSPLTWPRRGGSC
jgi:hypothetical protein